MRASLVLTVVMVFGLTAEVNAETTNGAPLQQCLAGQIPVIERVTNSDSAIAQVEDISTGLEPRPADDFTSLANPAATAPWTSWPSQHLVLRAEACQLAITQYVSDSPTLARIHAAMAGLYLHNEDVSNARTEIRKAVELNEQDDLVLANMAALHLKDGAYQDAVIAYSLALDNQAQPQNRAALYFNRALARRALGQYDQAAQDYADYQSSLKLTEPVYIK